MRRRHTVVSRLSHIKEKKKNMEIKRKVKRQAAAGNWTQETILGRILVFWATYRVVLRTEWDMYNVFWTQVDKNWSADMLGKTNLSTGLQSGNWQSGNWFHYCPGSTHYVHYDNLSQWFDKMEDPFWSHIHGKKLIKRSKSEERQSPGIEPRKQS